MRPQREFLSTKWKLSAILAMTFLVLITFKLQYVVWALEFETSRHEYIHPLRNILLYTFHPHFNRLHKANSSCTIIHNILIILNCTPESESSGNGCGLRPYRYLGAHRQGGAGIQRVRHGAAPLVRHAGQPPAPHRAVAHPQGPRRWREEGLNCTLR